MRLQMYGDHARVKLENARFKTFNKEFVGGVWDTLATQMELEMDPVPSAFKSHVEAPFQIQHRDGVIVKILVEATEPEFIPNIKKAAISQAWSALFTKDREGMTMRQMAESGEKIERASSYPTESVA